MIMFTTILRRPTYFSGIMRWWWCVVRYNTTALMKIVLDYLEKWHVYTQLVTCVHLACARAAAAVSKGTAKWTFGRLDVK